MKYEHFFYDWNPSFFRGFESSISLQPFISSDLPVCVIFSNLSCFLWTFQTAYARTYSHSKNYPSRFSTKYSTSTRNLIFQRQVIKWKVSALTVVIVMLTEFTWRGVWYFQVVFLELSWRISDIWLCCFFWRHIYTYVAISTILLVHLGAVKSKNTKRYHDSRPKVLTVLLLKIHVLWDKALCR